MNRLYFAHRRGFVLLDALIAVVVVSIGLFGVAKLNSVMLASTGIAKTRAEAAQLAEGKLEEIRAQQPPIAKPTSRTSPELISGVNASFQRTWTIVTAGVAGMDLDKIAVCVSWGDACGGTGERKVELNGLVTWTDLSTSAAVGSGENGISLGSFDTPTGVAVEGGNNGDPYTTLPSGTGVTINNDGTRIYQKTDKVKELIDDTSKLVLLTISDGTDFSTITGRVYITWGSAVDKKDKGNIDWEAINDSIRVLGSGGSACQQFLVDGGTTLPLYPASDTTNYSYFNYTCYMGKGWYGNIAIVRFDGGDRVCLGDPKVPDTDTTKTSRKPFLNPIRNYRGYTDVCSKTPASSACKSKGIGMSGDSYVSVALGGTGKYQHDFLLTTIKGQPENQDCAVEEEMPSPVDNPFIDTNTRLGNTGLLYCLSTTCPIASGFVTFQTNFTLRLTTSSTTPLDIEVDGGQCTKPTSPPATSPFDYSCKIDWLGWSGDYWAGNITVSNLPSSVILSNAALSLIKPDGSVVTLTDPIIGCDGACVQFTKVSKDVTSFTLSLSAL